ncbi:hypothetical protein ACFLVS_00735 [Chloroflexota bacterium]
MDDIGLIDRLLKLSEGKDLDFKSTSIRVDDNYHKAKFDEFQACIVVIEVVKRLR